MAKRDARVTDERLVDSRDILKVIPIHRGTLNAWIRAGQFPAPLKLSATKRLWRWSTILAWIDAREKQPAPAPAPARRHSKKRHR